MFSAIFSFKNDIYIFASLNVTQPKTVPSYHVKNPVSQSYIDVDLSANLNFCVPTTGAGQTRQLWRQSVARLNKVQTIVVCHITAKFVIKLRLFSRILHCRMGALSLVAMLIICHLQPSSQLRSATGNVQCT